MIELARLKRLLALIVALIGLILGLMAVRQVADAVLRSATGADPASVFNEVPPPPSDLLGIIEWLPDAPRDGRVMEPTTRAMITDAYARALAALDRAGRGDDSAPLGDYLGGPALEVALGQLGDARAVDATTVHLRQQLRLEYYSDDGAVVAVSVPRVEIVRTLEAAGTGRRVLPSDESWRFVMVLQDGNWRVQQLEIVEASAPRATGAVRRIPAQLGGVNTVTVNGVDPTWSGYDDVVGAVELAAVSELGLDTVRVFLGGPEGPPVDMDAFGRFLDLAADRGISVVPVLFDGSADQSVAGWGDDREYLDRVVGSVIGHEAIVLWDLKNEPDLDDHRSGGPAIVDAWLARVSAHVRSIDPVTPITVGWSSASHATRALGSVDVVSFHHFGDADELASGLAAVRTGIGERQLLVTEFGRPAWVGFVRGSQPAAQARRVAELIDVIEASDIDGAMVWVLRDPDRAIEQGVVASRASQSYGAFTSDWSRRPLAEVIGDHRQPVPGASWLERVRASLPVIVAIVAVLMLPVVANRVRRRLIRT